jgi:chemotaxis regulatin CheY-phosphate phosphatase CheZ
MPPEIANEDRTPESGDPKMRLVVGKKQLLADVVQLQGLLDQYCGFLSTIQPGVDWSAGAQQLLRGHVQFLEQARISIQSLELAAALIRHILEMRAGDALAIPTRGVDPSNGSADLRFLHGGKLGPEELRHLIAQVNSLSGYAPIAFQERLRFLLNGLLRFLEMVSRANAESIDEVLSEINLLTSNRESRHLVREVARLARDVYNSVKEVSDGLPLETLEETTEGASEAVRKLRSVIQRLEKAASENLDQLEKVEAIQHEDIQLLSSAQGASRSAQQDLAKMKAACPEATDEVDRILERMGNEVGGTLMQLTAGYERQSEMILQQVSNQSFQDLSGATLKKIISFVESVQMQLLGVLDRYRSVLSLVQNDLGVRPSDTAPQIKPKTEASQDQVDQLLAQYGF